VSLSILVVHPSALLTDHLPSGDGLAAYEFVRRLAERGHRLHVACQRVDLAAPPPPGVELHVLARAPELDARGRLAYMRRLRKLFERLRSAGAVDLAHQLNPVDAGLSLALPAGTPLVLGPYVPDWPAWSETGERAAGARMRHSAREATRRFVRRREQQAAHTVLLSTDAARQKLAVTGPRPAVELLPFGVDAGAFTPGTGAADGDPAVLFMGSLSRRKGIFTLLAAHERVVQRVPGARLLVAGAGEEEERVRELIAASPAREAIALLGPVERRAVPATMAVAHVACVPSYGEPFGLAALEAMASGLPVVGTAAGGLAHVLPDDGGVKVPPGDAELLAEALAALLTDPARREAMGTANRRLVERDYAWDSVIDRLERIYARTLAR
jgi:glycosyltransferase involved in cell wall biosynthesis